MQALGAALVDLVLRRFHVAEETVAVAVVIDIGREHHILRNGAALLVAQVTLAFGEDGGAGIDGEAPLVAALVPVVDHPHTAMVLVAHHPFIVAVGVAGELRAEIDRGLDLLRLVGKGGEQFAGIGPFADPHIARIGEIGAGRGRVVEEPRGVDHFETDLGIAPVAGLQRQLEPANAVDRAVESGNGGFFLPALLVEHIAQHCGRHLRAIFMLGRAGIALGVLALAFEQADDRIDLARHAVVGDHGLLALVQRLDLLRRPVRAVVIAPRFLLLVDLGTLAVEITQVILLQPRQGPAGRGRSGWGRGRNWRSRGVGQIAHRNSWITARMR